MTDKNLAYYQANPDELPDDEETLSALAEEVGSSAAPDEPPNEQPGAAAAGADTDASTDPAPKDAESEVPDPQPVGVATRDGKHIIPYDVLEQTRFERRKLHDDLVRTQAELDAIKAELTVREQQQVQALDQQAKKDDQEPDWEALEEEYPKVVVDNWRRQRETERAVQAFQQDLLTERERERMAADEAEVRAIQDAIDRSPTIAGWHARRATSEQARAEWNLARAVEEKLIADPAWANKSLDERFAEVVRIITGNTSQRDDIAARAEALIAKAKGAGSVPRSISDIPGGTPPAQSRTEAIANMSVHELAEMAGSISPDEWDHLLLSSG